MTGTGFAITDYVDWPTLSVMAMIGLMFVGASAGSPTGSVKIVRHLLVGRMLRRELRQTIHPELVIPIRLNGRPVDERTLRAVLAFVLLYIGIFIVGAALLAIDARVSDVEIGLTEAIAASAGTLGNVGPGLGFAGPMGSYEPFSDFSKLVMIFLMWIGRLEVLPVLVFLTRNYWRVLSPRCDALPGALGCPSRSAATRGANCPALPTTTIVSPVEDHVLGLGARDRLRLAEDRDHGDARALAERAVGRACDRSPSSRSAP